MTPIPYSPERTESTHVQFSRSPIHNGGVKWIGEKQKEGSRHRRAAPLVLEPIDFSTALLDMGSIEIIT